MTAGLSLARPQVDTATLVPAQRQPARRFIDPVRPAPGPRPLLAPGAVRWLVVLFSMAVPVPHLAMRVGGVLGVVILLGGFRRGRPQLERLALVAIFALWSGVVMALIGVIGNDRIYEMHQAAIIASAVLGFVGVITLVTWCCQVCSPFTTLVAAALALTLVPLTNPGLFFDNPWKFGLSWPVTVLGLALAQRGRRLWSLLVVAGSSVLSAAFDTRGMLLFCFCAATTLVLVAPVKKPSRRTVVLRVAGLVLALWGLAAFGTAVASSGVLGQQIQTKTIWQASSHENLIATARLEIPTSIDLLRRRPVGYGLGVVPNEQDRVHSLAATVAMGGSEDNALLGDPSITTFRLHSQLADLWFFLGLGAFPLLWFLGRQLVLGLLVPIPGLNQGQQGALAFLLSFACWDFFFSPFENNYTMSAVTVALVMALRTARPTPAEGAS